MASEGFENFSSVITSLAAVVAVYVGWMGLNTWKNQSIWQADNELARRILITLYRYRESLYSVRHPAMSNVEMALDPDESGEGPPDEKRRRGVILAYARRWERHSAKRNELDALILEADAVWGRELGALIGPVKSLEHELYVYVLLHLDAHYRGDSDLAREYRKILRTYRDILYDTMNDDDVYRTDFSGYLVPIESYLRDRLGRK